MRILFVFAIILSASLHAEDAARIRVVTDRAPGWWMGQSVSHMGELRTFEDNERVTEGVSAAAVRGFHFQACQAPRPREDPILAPGR